MVLYAVVEWNTTFSVIELNVGTDDPITGHPVADCSDIDQAHRIARLLADDSRDRAGLVAE